MIKTSSKIALILSFLGVSLLTGCGVTSTSLPSSLQPGGGGSLTISATTFPDAIAGRSYYLIIATSGGSGALAGCTVVSGAIPSGLSWSVSNTVPSECILSGTVAATAANSYPVVVQATDTSSPPKTDQLPYTLVVRNDYSICTGPTSAVAGCTAATATAATATSAPATTTSFPDASLNRSYGMGSLSHMVQTNLVGTADSNPVGHPGEFGNGPFTAAAVTGLPAGINATEQLTSSNFVVSGTAVTATPQTYTVTVTITDSPICASTPQQPCTVGNYVVPPRTVTRTYSHLVHPPITLLQSLGTAWPDAVHGRAYGTGTGCTGGTCTPAVYSVVTGNGLGGYVWPASTPASISATSMSCPAVATGNLSFTCSGTSITAGSATAGAASASMSPSVTVTDTPNTATPAATVTTDPLSTRTDTLWVDSPLLETLTQNGATNPTTLIPGVAGRSYGLVNASAAIPTYMATGGLGSRTVSTYEWCVNTGATSLPAGLGGIGTGCFPSFTTTRVATETLSASNITAAITGASQTFPFTVELDDTGNAATPSSVASGTRATNATSLLVNAALQVHLTQATNGTDPSNLLTAVTNRTYGAIGGTPTYTASDGLGGYVFPASPGPFASVAGFTCSSTTTNPYTCSATTAVGASPATYSSLSLTVTDTANPAVPNGTAMSTTSLLVNPQIQLAQSLGANWPDAVSGRAYGSGPGCTGGNCNPAMYSATNGLGGYVWPATTPASIAGIIGMACPPVAVGSSSYTCSSTGITAPPTSAGAAAMSYSPSATVTDTPNAATPAATVATDPNSTRTDTLWVDSPLLAILNQTGDSPATMNPANLLPGVSGRSYGVINAGNAAPTYSATGGLGSRAVATYEWCVNTGAASLPAGLAGITVGGSGTPCATFGPTGSAAASLSASNITAATATFPFTVELDDTGNMSTPTSVGPSLATSTSGTRATSLLINAPLAIQLTQTTNPTPATALLPGVLNRSYGVQFAGAGAPTYSATGGLMVGTSPTYFWCISGGSVPLTGISTTCGPTNSTAANTVTLSANPVSGSAGVFPYTVEADDGGNPAVPSTFVVPSANSMLGPTSLTIHPQIVVGLNFVPPPEAVLGRTYGSPARTDLIYTVPANQGLAPITMTGSGFPAPIACPMTTGTQQLNCNSANGNVTGATSAGTVTAADTANEAVPAATTATDPGSQRTTDTVTVDPVMTLTPPPSVPTAVTGRAYGTTGTCSPIATCAPLPYGIGGGLRLYQSPGTLTTSAGAGPFTCSLAGTTYSCGSSGITLAGPATPTLTMTATENGNNTTPGGTAIDSSQTLQVDPEMNFTVTPTSPFADAVNGRTYGQNSNCGVAGTSPCAPLTYTIQTGSGLGGYSYVYTVNGSNGGFACPGTTTTTNCSSPGVTEPANAAPYTGVHASVTDTANQSTPGNTIPSANGSLTVHSELSLTPPAVIATAVTGRTFGQGSTCGAAGTSPCVTLNYGIANGLGNYTTPATMTTTAGTFACPLSTATYQCSSGDITGSGTPNLSLMASETGNASTPGNSKTDNSKALPIDPEMNFTATPTSPFAVAVNGRTYGQGSNCGAGGTSPCTPLTYTIQTGSGLGGYSYAYSPSINVTCPGSAVTTNCVSSSVGGGANTYATAHASVTDTADASTPANTIASSNGSLTVNPELNFTATPPSFAVAVTGRTYGQNSNCGVAGTSACTPLAYSIQSGSGLGGYSYALTVNSGNGGFACTAGGTSTNCSSGDVTEASGTYNSVHASVTDTADAATPSNTIPSANGTLMVNNELALTPPALIATAVTGRTFGQGSTCGAAGTSPCATLNYGIQFGLGNYTTPATMTTTAGTFACPLSTATYQCSSGDITGSGSPTLSLKASETGNTSTPGNNVTDSSKTLAIRAEMSYTATPTSPFAFAVAGRTYGQGSNCGAGGTSPCTPLTYTIQNGSGLTPYAWAFSPSLNISCPGTTTTTNCTSPTIGAAGTYGTSHASVTDTANASTPANTIAATNGSLTINPELNFTSVPASPFNDAVNGRTYGQNSTCGAAGNSLCAPLAYGIQSGSGLGGYSYALIVNSGNGGFGCTAGAATTNCSSSGVTEAGNVAPYTGVHASVTDAANAATPSNTVPSPNGQLTVHSELTLTPPAGTLPTAVVGRTYGQGTTCGAAGNVACTTINYGIANGLGNYTSPATMTTTAGIFACPLSTATYLCSSGDITGSGSPNLSLTASETGNGSTPGNSKTDSSQSLTINPEMNFTATPTSPFATAVNGRTYGQGNNCGAAGNAACAALTYTIASGSGLSPYSWAYTVNSGSGGFSCPGTTNTTNCSTGSVTEATGTYNSVNAAVTDTANAATPSNTVASTNATLTVNAALALTSPTSPYPDAENGVTYGSAGSGCTTTPCTPLTYQVPYTVSTVDGLPPYVYSETPGSFPTNLGCTAADDPAPVPVGNGGILTCDATTGISAPGPFPQLFNPSVMVTDTANASVPSAAVTNPTSNLTVQTQLSIRDTVIPNALVGFVYNPSGPGVTIKSQGGIGAVTWVGPGDAATGACAAPTGTPPKLTFNDGTQLLSSGGTAFASGDASTADDAYPFQVCVTDTGNAATPQTAALPNPGSPPAPLVANNFVFDVLNTLAYTPETTTNAVDGINTTSNSVLGSAVSLSAAPTTNPNGVAITPDGIRAYVTLSNNTFAVIDTITNAQITGSPFSMPGASTCTSLAGVAITNDGRAYFACPTGTSGGVVDVISTADNATLVTELTTGDVPAGVAISPTVDPTSGKTLQVYVTLNVANELVIIANTATPTFATVNLTTTNGSPLGLAAVTNPGGDVYVYIAKNAAGTGTNYAGVDIVDATTATLQTPILFTSLTQLPVGVAATPDGAEVYVTLTDTSGPSAEVWVIDNLSTPASRTGSPFSLPDPAAAAANTGPVGVTIPPLSPTPTNGFFVYLAQSLANNVDVLQDNPTATPTHTANVTLNGVTPAPQGIASIPVPAVPPGLP